MGLHNLHPPRQEKWFRLRQHGMFGLGPRNYTMAGALLIIVRCSKASLACSRDSGAIDHGGVVFTAKRGQNSKYSLPDYAPIKGRALLKLYYQVAAKKK